MEVEMLTIPTPKQHDEIQVPRKCCALYTKSPFGGPRARSFVHQRVVQERTEQETISRLSML